MADASIIIEGRIVTEPRYNTSPKGDPVVNLRVLAGRSRKNDQGGYDTLSETAYEVSFWQDHAHLVDALKPQKGDSVRVTGTVGSVESYQGQNGESLSVKVNGDGLRVFPKKSDPVGPSGQATAGQSQNFGWGQQSDPWQSSQPTNQWGGQ